MPSDVGTYLIFKYIKYYTGCCSLNSFWIVSEILYIFYEMFFVEHQSIFLRLNCGSFLKIAFLKQLKDKKKLYF